MSGSKFSTSRGTVIYVARLPARVRRRTRCATSSPSPVRRTRTPTSPGTSSSAAPTSSWPTSGATWSTGRSRWRTRTSARSRSRPRWPTPTRAAGDVARGVRHGRRRCWRGRRFKQAAISEAMRVVAAANKYLSDQEPWKLQGRPGPPRHGPAHRAAGGLRREHAAHAVPAALRAEGARGAGRHRACGRRSRRSRRSRTSTAGPADYPVLTGDYAAEQARWESTPIEVGRPAGQADADLRQAGPGAGRDGRVGPDRR